MNPRTLARLAGVLAALLAAAALGRLLTRPGREPGLGPADLASRVSRLEFSKGSDAWTFGRVGGRWRAETPVDYPADSGALDGLLVKLAATSLSETLSEDPARREVFGLEDAAAARWRAFGPAKEGLLDLRAGKDGPNHPSAFVLLGASPAVTEARGVSAFELTRPGAAWLDLSLASATPSSVARLSVKHSKGGFALDRKNGVWPGSSRSAVEAAGGLKADRAVLAASAPARKEVGLDAPDMTVELFPAEKGAAPTTLRFGKIDSSGLRWAERAGETRLYFLVSDWMLAPLRKSPKDFK